LFYYELEVGSNAFVAGVDRVAQFGFEMFPKAAPNVSTMLFNNANRVLYNEVLQYT
jgi:hypothetical protein